MAPAGKRRRRRSGTAPAKKEPDDHIEELLLEEKRREDVEEEEEEDLLTRLPEELLTPIFTRLTLLDQVRLAAVSTFLRSLLVARRYPPAPQPPWEMVFSDGPPPERRPTWSFFFTVPDRREISFQLPRWYRQHGCFGASKGWLAMVSPVRSRLSLLNPASRCRIELCESYFPDVEKIVLSSSPASRDCIVAALYPLDSVRCCRPSDKFSITIDAGALKDIAFGRTGLLYTLNRIQSVVKVFSFDPQLKHQLVSLITIPEEEGITAGHCKESRLVEFDGDVVLVVKPCIRKPLARFTVFRLDLEGSRLIKDNQFIGCSLFLGDGFSETHLVRGSSSPVVEENFIYRNKTMAVSHRAAYFTPDATIQWKSKSQTITYVNE